MSGGTSWCSPRKARHLCIHRCGWPLPPPHHRGVDDINAHISQVHDDPDLDKGLAFTYDQHIESGDCLLLPG